MSNSTGLFGQMQKEVRVEAIKCTCGASFQGEIAIYSRGNVSREVRPRECPSCAEARQQREVEEAKAGRVQELMRLKIAWRRALGFGVHDFKTFENFEARYQPRACRTTRTWAQEFNPQSPRGYPSLLLWSRGWGVGKTHLAEAACNLIINSWDGDPEHALCPVSYLSGPAMVKRVRATYNIPRDQPEHETEEMVYAELRGVPLLVLDDMGKENASAHTREVYFYILDEREKWGLPVLVTSNLPPEGSDSLEGLMGGATVSRLLGMTRGNCFELKGQDFRRRL